MEKRPNNNHIVERSYVGDAEFDYRIFKIAIGACGLISVIIALMMLAAGSVGLIWMIKLVFEC